MVACAALAACGGDSASRDAAVDSDADDSDVAVDSGEGADGDAVDDAAPDSDGADRDSAPDAIDTADADSTDTAASWDPAPTRAMDCAPDRAAPLTDAILAAAGLSRATFTFSPEDYAGSAYFAAGALDDPFRLPSFRAIQGAPLDAGCFADAAAGALDDLARGPHPIAAMIRRAAADLDRVADGPPMIDTTIDLATAIRAACSAAGTTCDAGDLSAIPPDLQRDLAPIVSALGDAARARAALVADAPVLTARAWVEEAGFGMVPSTALTYLQRGPVRAHLEGRDTLPALFLAAARVAFAIEAVDWVTHRDEHVDFELATPLGRIVLRGPAVDTYEPGPAPLLLVDTGGDDVHRDGAGANDVEVGVSVVIDLGGDDTYGFAAHDEGGLATDDDGRFAAGAPATDNGPITRSRRGRQGSGRHGIGMLFDLGQGADRYDSLAASQGYAALGVGVLFDDGGADHYTSEVASQGAALAGIGLAVDLGAGDDTRYLVNSGQGYGGIAGLGVLFDQGGDDRYEADPGPIAAADPALAPQPLYFSPQMAGQANNSLAQGASSGLRWDSAGLFLSGGRGILRDAAGDDTYLAGLFAQGAGYWQGIGLLSDGDGRDRYDALYYVQGAGAHYAVGLLMDGGQGGDWVNQTLAPIYVHVGSGHDFTLGVFVNEAGDDVYRYAGLGAGASNCNGIGVFVDDAGDDTYVTATDYGSGLGNVSDECAAARPDPKSVGLMLDAGGIDSYAWPESSFPAPGDERSWGHVTHGLPSEHGAGLDAAGETGIHAP